MSPYSPSCFVDDMRQSRWPIYNFMFLREYRRLCNKSGFMEEHRCIGSRRQVLGMSHTFQRGGAMFALKMEIKVLQRPEEMRGRLTESRAAERVLERGMRSGKRGF